MYTFIFRVACWIEKESTSRIASIIFCATVRSNVLSPGTESILLLPLPSCSSPPCYEFFVVVFFVCFFFFYLLGRPMVVILRVKYIVFIFIFMLHYHKMYLLKISLEIYTYAVIT